MDKRYETVGRLNITVDKSVGKLMVMVDESFFLSRPHLLRRAREKPQRNERWMSGGEKTDNNET